MKGENMKKRFFVVLTLFTFSLSYGFGLRYNF